MKQFNQEEFNKFILDNNVIGFFKEPVELKSGRTSSWYLNWRDIAEDVFLMNQLTDYVIAFTRDYGLEPDCFFGVHEGATKLGLLTQYKWAKDSPNYGPHTHTLAIGRGKPKDHGLPKDRYFLGYPKGKTIVLEDVATTGGSLLNTIDFLTEAEVIAAFALTDRMELRDDGLTVKQAVESRGISYYALSNALQLLPEAYRRLNPGQDIARAVEEEFQRYGTHRLTLR
jgi:orotate phosphoribosyltransferase